MEKNHIPSPHRLKRLLQAALILLIAVHLGYGILAYFRLSLGQALAQGLFIFFGMILSYGVLAYVLLPWIWSRHYRGQNPIPSGEKITRTKEGIPGDPLNVGLVGSETEVIQAMLTAQWLPADPASVQTVLGIVKNILFHSPDPTAPVSPLYWGGHQQDLAFEHLSGKEVKQRHHVRFWRAEGHEAGGRPLWVGAATFDVSYRVSRYTGQILHRIAPEIDAERDQLIQNLTAAGELERAFAAAGVGVSLNGRNGEGDWYYTDGQMTIGVLKVQK